MNHCRGFRINCVDQTTVLMLSAFITSQVTVAERFSFRAVRNMHISLQTNVSLFPSVELLRLKLQERNSHFTFTESKSLREVVKLI